MHRRVLSCQAHTLHTKHCRTIHKTVPRLRPEEYAGLTGTGVVAVVDVNCCEAHNKAGLFFDCIKALCYCCYVK